MLTNQSEVLLRNLDAFNNLDVVLVNPEPDFIAGELQNTVSKLSVFTQNFQQLNHFKGQLDEQNCHFSAVYQPEQLHDAAIVYYPKAKALADILIAQISKAVKPDGLIFLIGDNKGGIKSAAKRLVKLNVPAQKLDSARHCSLLCWKNNPDYFADVVEHINEYQYSDLNIISLAGVFSQDGLDPGTALLLENLPRKIKGNVLDFACGSGVIGCVLKQKLPEINLEMLDVSALAVESSKQTLAANNMQANVFASDGLSEVKERYHWIITNPPFHTGLKTDYSITETFIRDCKKHLKMKGKLLLVANSHLKYQPVLDEHFRHVEVLAKTSKFVLYLAE